MPTFRQMSETVSPLARSRSASRSNRATSTAVLRLLMGPSVSQSTRRLPFRLDQFLGSRPAFSRPQWLLTRLGYRYMRRLQKRFGRESAAAMVRAVNNVERVSNREEKP